MRRVYGCVGFGAVCVFDFEVVDDVGVGSREERHARLLDATGVPRS